jgi:predicted aconitase
VDLTDYDRALLGGEKGKALQFAMEVVVRAGEVMGAPHLIDVSFAHIDACHYQGQAHLDFIRFMAEHGARFEIPAWTTTLPISLTGREAREDADPILLRDARAVADLYVVLGCKPMWTCAPYQLPGGPKFGDQIVVGESNAVVYYNSVIGARTNKYGDFFDACAGLTHRAPFAGLHRDEERAAHIVLDIRNLPEALRHTELFCHVLGHLAGRRAGSRVPAVVGLPKETPGDSLKAIGAACAASGGVGMFHAVGITPEAPTLEAATQGRVPDETIAVRAEMIIAARDSLSSAGAGAISMVAVGTPHFSFTEFEALVRLLDGRKVAPGVAFYASTSRHVAALLKAKGWAESLERSGVDVLVDTCTYWAPPVRACSGRVMTNSAKWAYYAPGMLPVEVAFGGLDDCVESAVHGEVRRSKVGWSDSAWGAA